MQVDAQQKPPVGIIFDCDLGDSIDDTLALAFLHGLARQENPQCHLVSVSITKSNLHAAAFAEATDRFYSNQTNRDIPERYRRYRGLVIGLSDRGWSPDATPLLSAPLNKRDASGKPLYSHEIERFTDTADPATTIRNALTAQHDQNAVVVLSGPATNLARVLDLRGAKALIAEKVRFLSVMGGTYPRGGPEYNIESDIPAATKLFNEWPTPIIASGAEVGDVLHYPGASIDSDFAGLSIIRSSMRTVPTRRCRTTPPAGTLQPRSTPYARATAISPFPCLEPFGCLLTDERNSSRTPRESIAT